MRTVSLAVAVLSLSLVAAACSDATSNPTGLRPQGASLGKGGVPAGGPKVTLCHAAGRAGTTHFITLTIPTKAANKHIDDHGTTAAGHEQDYLGACTTPPEAQGTLTVCVGNYTRFAGSGIPGAPLALGDANITGDVTTTITIPNADGTTNFQFTCDDPVAVLAGDNTLTHQGAGDIWVDHIVTDAAITTNPGNTGSVNFKGQPVTIVLNIAANANNTITFWDAR